MLTPVGSLVFCEAGLSSAQVYDLAFLDGNESSVTGELKLVSTIRFLPLVFMRPLFSCSSVLFPLHYYLDIFCYLIRDNQISTKEAKWPKTETTKPSTGPDGMNVLR
jgi:hypothetical protein